MLVQKSMLYSSPQHNTLSGFKLVFALYSHSALSFSSTLDNSFIQYTISHWYQQSINGTDPKWPTQTQATILPHSPAERVGEFSRSSCDLQFFLGRCCYFFLFQIIILKKKDATVNVALTQQRRMHCTRKCERQIVRLFYWNHSTVWIRHYLSRKKPKYEKKRITVHYFQLHKFSLSFESQLCIA